MAWDATLPENSAYLVAAAMRANWEAIQDQGLGVNYLGDPAMLIWPDGDAADPAWWTSGGTGVAVARETSTVKSISAAKVTYGSSTAQLYQDLLASGDYLQSFDGRTFSMGAWIYPTSSDATIFISDGASITESSAGTASTWNWKKLTHTIDDSATYLRAGLQVDAAGYGIMDMPTLVAGPIPPDFPDPGRVTYGTIAVPFSGNPVATGQKLIYSHNKPFIVEWCHLQCLSAVAGQNMIADLNFWNGSAWVSMFSTRPTVDFGTSEVEAGAAPDGTYQNRCFHPSFSTGAATRTLGTALSFDLDQAATSGGQNPTVIVAAKSWTPPLTSLRAYNSYK